VTSRGEWEEFSHAEGRNETDGKKNKQTEKGRAKHPWINAADEYIEILWL